MPCSSEEGIGGDCQESSHIKSSLDKCIRFFGHWAQMATIATRRFPKFIVQTLVSDSLCRCIRSNVITKELLLLGAATPIELSERWWASGFDKSI